MAHESQCRPKQVNLTHGAVMLFAPECAQWPLQAGEIVWGSEPLPVVDKYQYLGVMLASDCTWQAHVEHVVAKATTDSQLCHGQRAAQS